MNRPGDKACKGCGESIPAHELIVGYCRACITEPSKGKPKKPEPPPELPPGIKMFFVDSAADVPVLMESMERIRQHSHELQHIIGSFGYGRDDYTFVVVKLMRVVATWGAMLLGQVDATNNDVLATRTRLEAIEAIGSLFKGKIQEYLHEVGVETAVPPSLVRTKAIVDEMLEDVIVRAREAAEKGGSPPEQIQSLEKTLRTKYARPIEEDIPA